MALLSDNIAEGGSSLLFPKGTAVIPTGATHAFVTTGEYATCKGTLDSTAPHGGAKVLFDGREGWKSQTFGDWDGGAWTTVRIDLKKIRLVGKVEIRALREALRDTERADVLFSLDGETFLQHGIAENKTAGAGGKDNFIPLTAVFETPVQARHVELRIRKARHQQQIGEIAIWGWLASDDPKANFIPAGEKPKVAFSARPIQDGAAQISWTEYARQAKGVTGWRIYHARQSFARVDEPGVTLLREFKAGQTSAAVYPFEPGSTVYFGITALYPEGESPSVQAAPLRFRTPFERNTFGDMLAINHFIGGGAKSRGQAWDEVSLDMLAETPFRESRWWFMFPETVKRFLDRGVGMITWPIVDAQPVRHNIRNANALGLHAFSKGNEPELKGVSPAAYLEGLKKEYAAAKALSPWDTLGAPTCNIWPTAPDWLEAFYRAGAKDYFDVLDLHTYTTPPEDLFGRIQRVREIMAEHGDAPSARPQSLPPATRGAIPDASRISAWRPCGIGRGHSALPDDEWRLQAALLDRSRRASGPGAVGRLVGRRRRGRRSGNAPDVLQGLGSAPHLVRGRILQRRNVPDACRPSWGRRIGLAELDDFTHQPKEDSMNINAINFAMAAAALMLQPLDTCGVTVSTPYVNAYSSPESTNDFTLGASPSNKANYVTWPLSGGRHYNLLDGAKAVSTLYGWATLDFQDLGGAPSEARNFGIRIAMQARSTVSTTTNMPGGFQGLCALASDADLDR